MEFSFENERPRSSSPSSSSSAIGSDRLRKAIERNRAKQAKRSGQAARAASAPAADDWSLPGSGSTRASTSARGTRRSVASADNVEFTTALRKSSRAPAPVNYSEAKTPTVVSRKTTRKVSNTRSTAKTTRSRSKSKLLKNTNEYVVKGVWVFCALLLLRLIFSDGGVRDYYAKKDVLQSRFDELARIQKENEGLVKEIDLLRKDPRYQKKVVRDHLGYISRDEYLILFPENM